MKRVLVFGGNTGVLASRVAYALASDGLQVLFADSQLDTTHPSIVCKTFNITDVTAMSAAVAETDAVISCVEAHPALIAGSATALFDALKPTPDKRVVLFSSMAVYGDVEGTVTEQTSLVAGDAYANARIHAEILAKSVNNSICLRCGVEYGRGSERWSGLVGRLLLAKRLGDLGAAGDGYCNLIFMDDLVNAIGKALRLPGTQYQVFNLCMRERITWNEYLIRYSVALNAVPVKRIRNRQLKLEKVFGIPLKILEKAIGTSMARKLWVPVPITSSMVQVFNHRIALDSTLAEQGLGMQWTALDQGLEAAANWMISTK